MIAVLKQAWSLTTTRVTVESPGHSLPLSSSDNRRLIRMVQDADHFVPVYRHHWQKAGIAVRDLDDNINFTALPIIGKTDFLAVDPADHVDERYRYAKLSSEKTSGSTGQPFVTYMRRTTHLRRRMRFLSGLLAVGYRPGKRLMIISTRRSAKTMHPLRWHYVDLRASEHELLEQYRRFRPHVVYGPLSALLSLAHKLTDTTDLQHQPEILISTAEELTYRHRTTLQQAFGTEVTDFYGATEFGLLAWRRPHDHYYSYSKDFLLEFLPSPHDRNVERLVVTDLRGGVMPWIRFETGDLVRRDRTHKGVPIIHFSGRDVDGIALPDGRRLSPYAITMALESVAGIDRYQVIQQADLAIDVFIWSKASGAQSILDRARQAVDAACGNCLTVSVHRATAPLTDARSKLRPVQSVATRGLAFGKTR